MPSHRALLIFVASLHISSDPEPASLLCNLCDNASHTYLSSLVFPQKMQHSCSPLHPPVIRRIFSNPFALADRAAPTPRHGFVYSTRLLPWTISADVYRTLYILFFSFAFRFLPCN